VTSNEKPSSGKLQTYFSKLVKSVFPGKSKMGSDVSSSSAEAGSRMRLKQLSNKSHVDHAPHSAGAMMETNKSADAQATRSGLSYWRNGVQHMAVPPVEAKKTGSWRFQFEENPLHELIKEKEKEREKQLRLESVEFNLSPNAVSEADKQSGLDLSDSAQREVLRIAMMKREQIARSLALSGESKPGQSEQGIDETRDGKSLQQPRTLPGPHLPVGNPAPGPQLETQPAAPSQKTVPLQTNLNKTKLVDPSPPRPDGAPPKNQASNGNQGNNNNPFKDYSDTALMLLAQNSSTDAETLFWLAGHHNMDIRCAVARSANCPLEALSILAKDHEPGIRHAIAENPGSSMHILRMLADDSNPLVSWRAQNNINAKRQGRKTTTIRVQSVPKPENAVRRNSQERPILPISEDLAATEETIAFLRLIALKTNTPPRRLSELARHPDPTVRAAVAENANTPSEMLWILARDTDQEVKIKVTDNYNCPTEILEALKEDGDSYVAWQARNVLHRLTSTSYPTATAFEERTSGGGRNITRP
jgi:hypothetical protein